jgi:hypothetical protein
MKIISKLNNRFIHFLVALLLLQGCSFFDIFDPPTYECEKKRAICDEARKKKKECENCEEKYKFDCYRQLSVLQKRCTDAIGRCEASRTKYKKKGKLVIPPRVRRLFN